jgi:hypothetical protein
MLPNSVLYRRLPFPLLDRILYVSDCNCLKNYHIFPTRIRKWLIDHHARIFTWMIQPSSRFRDNFIDDSKPQSSKPLVLSWNDYHAEQHTKACVNRRLTAYTAQDLKRQLDQHPSRPVRPVNRRIRSTGANRPHSRSAPPGIRCSPHCPALDHLIAKKYISLYEVWSGSSILILAP